VFLDELDPSAGNYRSEFETECGVTCTAFQHGVQSTVVVLAPIMRDWFGDEEDKAWEYLQTRHAAKE